MSYSSPYHSFRFKQYSFDQTTGLAEFRYSFDDSVHFREVIQFAAPQSSYCAEALDAALLYCSIVLGTSYYKLFPGAGFELVNNSLTADQAAFFSALYRGGLSQFIYENELSPDLIPAFEAGSKTANACSTYNGEGILLQQSGGKDSLLAARLLTQGAHTFDSWHMSTTGNHAAIIDQFSPQSVINVVRTIDLPAITAARNNGGLNGHVPFSAITAGLALVDAVLRRKRYVIAAMEASSDEGNTVIGDFEVNHMYSKTFQFEQSLQSYIHSHIASDLDYLSLIRPFTDLRVAEMFAEYCWQDAVNGFSSCNVANYKQGQDTGQLSWCGDCSKCANSFLLFAPFIAYEQLTAVFDGQNLFTKPSLRSDFEALLGITAVKPFECVGTVDELRAAYHLAQAADARFEISGLAVPVAQEDYRAIHPHQQLIELFLERGLLEAVDS